MKEEALDRAVSRTRFGRDCGSVVRAYRSNERMREKYGVMSYAFVNKVFFSFSVQVNITRSESSCLTGSNTGGMDDDPILRCRFVAGSD